MKAMKNLITLSSCLALALGAAACSDDDDNNDEGTGGMTGDGDGAGGMTGDGDGDGDGAGGMTGDGDGDGDGAGGMAGDGDGDGDGMGGEGGATSCSTILEIAAATDDLSSLVAAVEAAGIGDALTGDDLTVFAPTNEAFTALLEALDLEFADLTPETLIPILTYHVAGSVVPASAAIEVAQSDDNTFGTLGGTIQLDVEGEDLVIDTDEASATVVMPDVEACNGVVHVIDSVLLPSITDIVVSQDSFSGLETLIGASSSDEVDVAAALDGPSGEGAWTLFAPDNDAVDALLALDLGLTPDNVTTALLYHAYASETPVDAATALTLDTTVATAGGENLAILGGDGVVLTDGAGNEVSVTIADIYSANGIIHRIEAVLLPPSLVE